MDQKGRLRFLFHPHAGTSVVQFNTWMECKARWVRNPGKRGQKAFRAGFHFFPKEESAAKFQKLTKGKYLILPVLVAEVRPKPRTNVGSWLARYLFVPEKEEAG
ncbi:MAG: hypothetical protein WDZ67_01975 [Patescibacteria group bacterium]